jgi:hypothetical protein
MTWDQLRASLYQLSCAIHVREFKIFVFEISFDFIYFGHAWAKPHHNKSANKEG